MKQWTRFAAVVALAVWVVWPILAQDADPGPGEGGIVVQSNLGDDPSTFNPIISGDTSSATVHDLMYPAIIGLDDETLAEAPNVPQALATGWEYDETGTVLTVFLREDAFWADGEQITAEDWVWAYNAVKSGLTSSPRTSALYQLDDGTITEGPIHAVTVIDDFTVAIRLGTVARDEAGEVILTEDGVPELLPSCTALSDVNDIAVVPAHIYEAAFGSDYGAMDDDPYFVPRNADEVAATFGPFTDPFIEFGVQTSLLANQAYPDTTTLDYVAPSEWIFQNVEDQTIAYENFLAGDYSTFGVPANRQNEFRALIESGEADFSVIEYPSNGYTYLGYNLANPDNPQPARDETGALIEQDLNRFFSDVRVRQAFAYAVDVREIIGTLPDGDTPATGILEGNGYELGTHNHPGLSSTDDELAELGVEPYPYEPETALALLNEAGWVDVDDDGILECSGCLYATEVDPAFEGEEFVFELLTNSGNNIREATGETIVQQLEAIGVVAEFQAIEFGALIDIIDGQTFDAFILGWNLGLPFDPGGGLSAFFGVGADIPFGGFNSGSYINPEMDALVEQAESLPGCDPDERDALYAEAQRIIWEDQPYLFLYAGNTMVAAQGDLGNWDPFPYNTDWNIDSWSPGE